MSEADEKSTTLSGGSSSAVWSSQQQLSKRRRSLGAVTPNACNEYRKKRAKVSSPLSLAVTLVGPDVTFC